MPDLHPIPVDTTTPPPTRPTPPHPRLPRRILLALAVLLLLLLAALLPPYINVNHYQRRIVTSISSSLGRPVHLDNITLNLLPLPSFTLQNFVVDEDPAFGDEPIIRAGSVTASLRASSLWRRRVEFSTISFQDPSVNLVHNPDGKWNLDSILLQASRVSSAPTAEKHPGPAPRFPYIEATGARINLKLGQEKTPFSLTDTAFALWQPDPGQWRFRLKGAPARTDTDVSDTGRLELEASLGRASTLRDVPLTLHATWRSPPLGQTTRFLTGSDAGLRGDMALIVEATGTVGEAALHAHLHLTDLRRDRFVPEHPLTLDLDCLSDARRQFHTFTGIRCAWPVAGTDHALVALTGTVPDLRTPAALDLQLGASRLPSNTLLTWLRIASRRIPPDLTATGSLNGTLAFNSTHPGPAQAQPAPSALTPSPLWTGEATLGPLSLSSPALGAMPLAIGELNLTTGPAALPTRRSASSTPSLNRGGATNPPETRGVTLLPTTLDLGGKDPALLDGFFNHSGYRLHLTGTALPTRLAAVAKAIPLFGTGLSAILTPAPPNTSSIPSGPLLNATVPSAAATSPGNPAEMSSAPATSPVAGIPAHLDLTATATWSGPQTWTDNTRSPTPPTSPITHRRKHHRR